MSVRKMLVSGGVSYHLNLSQHGEPFADFERVNVLSLPAIAVENYDVAVVPRSTDNEALFARRYQMRRFLDDGGVLVVLGDQPTNWFPNAQWQPESAEDILEPIIEQDHPVLGGLPASRLDFHGKGRRWCCHGHYQAPEHADVLVANQAGGAWLYVDRSSTNGVIIASSNLDADMHMSKGSSVARGYLERLLAWAEAEAEQLQHANRPSSPRIAGLYSGVFFQRSFYSDAEFADAFSIVPIQELEGLPLESYPVLWVPRESNQDILMQAKERLKSYLVQGGTLVCFDEANQDWLPFARWQPRRVDTSALILREHPLIDGLEYENIGWGHAHGHYVPNSNADVLIHGPEGQAVLYIDERSSQGGRVLGSTLDADCHAGYGSGVTKPLLRRIIEWARGPVAAPASAVETTVGI